MPLRALLRTLTHTLGVSLLWLLTASNADAAPGPRPSSAAALCDARPTAWPKRLLRVDPTPWFVRARHTENVNDAAAIQDDAPAARLGADDGTLSSLRPIGFLAGDVDSRSLSVSFSPRSPRGPPTTA